MKTSLKISHLLIGLLALLVGFAFAWWVKPGHEHDAQFASSETPVVLSAQTQSEPESWTCSMHPQIRQNEPGDCPICGMDLIPASASQVAHIPGRIEQLFVSFTGQQIYKGQKLATVYSPALLTAQRELLEAVKLKDTNPGLLKSARKKLEYWKIPANTITEIESSGEVQENFTLTADVSGVVSGRRVAVGDYVKQGQIMLDLVNLNRVWVIFDAYEKDLPNLAVGDKIEFASTAIPGQKFSTRISFIDPVVDAASRVISVRGEVRNTQGLLKPEMFIEGVAQAATEQTEQLTVPRSAVLWTGKRSVVYVKVPGTRVPSFRFREVSLGERTGEYYLIEEGLAVGEEVVTQGSFTIDAAAQLNNQRSMMNQQVQVEGGSDSSLPNYIASTPEAFQNQLTSLAANYFALKDALVATDADAAQKAIQPFLSRLEVLDMDLLSPEAHDFWMEQQKAMQFHGRKISSSLEIGVQREQFKYLSDALTASIQALGLSGDTLYVQHCPMAMDDQGADWLSAEANILNPYFGDVMLTCGWVADTLTQVVQTLPQNVNSNQFHNH